MSKLPAEILIEVFKFLHFQEKLEYMLVCRSWAQILQDGYLFETIELSVTSSLKSFDKRLDLLLKHAKSVYQPGRNCKRLLIDNTGDLYRYRGISGAKIATSFPNLNFLQFTSTIVYDPKAGNLRSTPFNSDPYVGWRKSLETMIDYHSYDSTLLGILTTGVFSRLTTLTVLPKFAKYEQSYYEWLSNLKNTPALTTLTIIGSYLSITNLEELHKNTPKLTSLSLYFGFRASPISLNSLKITPTEKMKVFKIICCTKSNKSHTDSFLQYAKMKYTNLEEFYYSEGTYEYSARDNTNVVSKSAWPDFISAIGPGLNKLGIREILQLHGNLNLIEEYATELKHLDVTLFTLFNEPQMLQKITSSQNFYGLVSLTLRTIPPLFKMTVFRRFTELKELYLGFKQDYDSASRIMYFPLEIADIINDLPKNIRTLCLQFAFIISSRKPIQDSLNIINFKAYTCVIEDEYIYDAMTRHIPMLKSLVLDSCRLSSRFELPNHHLHYLEIKPLNAQTAIYSTQKYTKETVKENEQEFTHLRITVQNQTITYKLPVVEVDYKGAKETVGCDDRSMQRVLKASAPDSSLNYLDITLKDVDTIMYCDYLLL